MLLHTSSLERLNQATVSLGPIVGPVLALSVWENGVSFVLKALRRFHHGESMARQYDDEPEDDDAIHVEDEIDLDQPVNTGGSHQGGPWPWY